MINRLPLLIVAASISFASCKKDKSNPTPDPIPVEKKLSSVEENGVRTAAFKYNTDGTLKEVQATFGGSTTTFTYSYNAQKKHVELVSDEDYKVKYIYENGVLRLTENYDGAQKVSENSFVFENGKMKSNTLFTAFPKQDGSILYKPTFRAVYTYNANGSVQKVSNYVWDGSQNGTLELESEYVFESYDNKKNPFSVLSDFSQVLMFQPVHINNPIREKYSDAAGATLETTDYTYTYDAAGYPLTVKSTVTPTGGQATVTNTKFNY